MKKIIKWLLTPFEPHIRVETKKYPNGETYYIVRYRNLKLSKKTKHDLKFYNQYMTIEEATCKGLQILAEDRENRYII